MSARGSPQLFQEGETFESQPLVDYQHPHDFFMNVSATYRHPLGTEGGIWFQLAPVGEPALGPPAFMPFALPRERTPPRLSVITARIRRTSLSG